KGNPQLSVPGVHDPILFFDHGHGTYWAAEPAPQNSDPTRSNIRPRVLDLQGNNTSGESPYDMNSFRAALAGHQTIITTNAYNTADKSQEKIRLLSKPISKDGQIQRVLQYPQPLASTDQALAGLTRTLVIALPLILLVSAFGGVYLTGRALKPVREITNTAAEVGAESLSGRLEVKGNDEFSRLAQTFNGMLERLQGAFGRMEHAVEQQRRFTADASHELRTPLTVIKANTSLAMKGQRSVEEYQKTLAAVNSAADTMNRLVNDLLLLARSDHGKLEFDREPICLKPLLKDAIAAVARPGVASISLQMENEGEEILGDGHAIIRVFVNLLENAARYTPEGGSIVVHPSREGDEIVISVRDTGVGIAPEHLPHLTDRFYRVDEARASAQGGNGLGLSICSSIVEAHNGSISIESMPDDGTTVTVRLPAAPRNDD
ncbi:MAG: sensor histidine kinase, partial [Fimbriimonadales bacterium]